LIRALVVADAALLMACASMYFGTGWSLVLFQFPLRSQITPANYYLPFVAPVAAATRFFTWMTVVMIVAAGLLIVASWGTILALAPVVALAGVVAATLLTIVFVLPINRQLAAGIKDEATLNPLLDRWMRLNTIRVAFWTVEWLAILVYLAVEIR
jgi:Domain of unknown function (DUF1772)